MRDFKKIYEVFRDNVNEIFGDEESRFDYLCTRVEELDSKMYSDLFLLGSKDVSNNLVVIIHKTN